MTVCHPSIAEQRGHLHGPVMLRQRQEHAGLYHDGLKRCVDVLAVLCSLPLIVILALLISIDGHSSLYRQKRLDRNGRAFTLWNLRSMVHGEDARLEAYLSAIPAARAEWTGTQKLKEDPRITGIGCVLRKSSVHELPQLWNGLRGDKSLVAPLMMPERAPLYARIAYYALRPRITGSGQVSAHNDSSCADHARFDTAYERQVSVAADFALLLATVRPVPHGTAH